MSPYCWVFCKLLDYEYDLLFPFAEESTSWTIQRQMNGHGSRLCSGDTSFSFSSSACSWEVDTLFFAKKATGCRIISLLD